MKLSDIQLQYLADRVYAYFHVAEIADTYRQAKLCNALEAALRDLPMQEETHVKLEWLARDKCKVLLNGMEVPHVVRVSHAIGVDTNRWHRITLEFDATNIEGFDGPE